MCYSVLQCIAVCCSVLQCIAVCCSVLQCVAVCAVFYSVLQCLAVSAAHHDSAIFCKRALCFSFGYTFFWIHQEPCAYSEVENLVDDSFFFGM